MTNLVTNDEIRIGMSVPLTGTFRALGIELVRGSETYIKYRNDQGGVNGRKITLLIRDDAYKATRTLENTKLFLENDNVFSLFAYVGTPTTVRILPLLKHYETFLLFPFTGAQPHREYP